MISITLFINGHTQSVSVSPFQTLAEVLRYRLGITGTKIGCNQGVCGACTVFIDGRSARACLTVAATCQGKTVTTRRGLEAKRTTVAFATRIC